MPEAVRSRIEIDVRTSGADAAKKSLDALVGSEEALVKTTDRVVKVQERNEIALERLARKHDQEFRSTQDAARAQGVLERARKSGLAGTEAYQRALSGLNRVTNDNAKLSALQRHEWINLSRQAQDVAVSLAGGQKPMTVLLQQGSQIADVFSSSRGGASAALREFGAVATRALFSPIGIAASLAGGLLAVKAAGDAAGASLAALGEKARSTGLSANEITGARIVGARAGLDDKESFGALQNATREFAAFGRNSGAVKSFLETVDKGFLGVADRARSAGEWIDRIEQKIRALPKAQGLELSKALFGDDAGRKLFEQVQQGAVSMASLRAETEKAGGNFDVVAEHAERMKREIAEIDAIASTRLLSTFGALADPVLALERAWANMKLGILDVERSARQLKDTLRFNAGEALGVQGEAASTVFARMRQQRLGDPFAGKTMADVDPLTNLFTQGQKPRSVGEDRALFTKPEKARHAGLTDAEKSASAYQRISRELENQISLATALGAEHDNVALKIKIENEQLKLGSAATAEQKAHIAELVTHLSEAERAQKNATKEAEAYRDTMKEASSIAKDSMKGLVADLREGNSLGKSLQNTIASISTKILNKGIDTAIDSAFNMLGGGSKSGGGGFGFGPVGKTVGSVASSLGASSTVSTVASTLASAASALFSGGSMFRRRRRYDVARPCAVASLRRRWSRQLSSTRHVWRR
ncbi:phage tail length tape measure family protein [Methylocystis sp.]|uniref:phage tail length tape measure family protein n=1 Tax=Methylocystis sp. TaxID=1911079 RepID=UPI003DA606D1